MSQEGMKHELANNSTYISEKSRAPSAPGDFPRKINDHPKSNGKTQGQRAVNQDPNEPLKVQPWILHQTAFSVSKNI